MIAAIGKDLGVLLFTGNAGQVGIKTAKPRRNCEGAVIVSAFPSRFMGQLRFAEETS
jgi:hypothetical protein